MGAVESSKRCVICGAPFMGDEDRCFRCLQRQQSLSPAVRKSGPGRAPDPLRDTDPGLAGTTGPGTSGGSQPGDHRGSLPLHSVSLPPTVSSSVVLEGKYRLMGELGRGSMGTVFLAEDTSLQRQVAVKFLLPELSDSSECTEQFRQEAVGMAAIHHPNVVQIFSYGVHNDTPYFVMELVEGQSVESMIDTQNRRNTFVPLQDVFEILLQSLSGLSAIHKAGMVHRDIKPANIMLADDPMRALIMDFGLMRDVQVEEDTRALAGTPAYIAPELVNGIAGASRSHLVDIYSMGTTAYEMLTGSIPFMGNSWIEILQKHITEIPAPPSVRRAGIPEELDDIILLAMSKDPRERYQSCSDFIDTLLEFERSPLTRGRRMSLMPPTRPSVPGVRRRRASDPAESPRRTPRSVRSTPGRSSGSDRLASTRKRGQLLVADADSEFRALVQESAKAAVPGCRVHAATDGAMALTMVDKIRPHVLIVDLALPQVNGLEVVATVVGDDLNAHTRIIVVTDQGGEMEAGILAEMGVDVFLTKPVDAKKLANLVRPPLEQPLRLSGESPPGG